MKNLFHSFSILFFIIGLVTTNAQEYKYTPVDLFAVKGSILSKSGTNDFFITKEQNTNVLGWDGPVYDNPDEFKCTVLFEDREYSVDATKLIPANAHDFFPDSMLTNPRNHSRYKWTCSYYLDVLRKGNRNALYAYEKKYLDEKDRALLIDTDYLGVPDRWWTSSRNYERILIFQSTIALGSVEIRGLWIVDNIYQNKSYLLTVHVDRYYTEYLDSANLPFPSYKDRPTFQLRLVPDGDYMDVYLDNDTKKLATFVLVDQSILSELNTLVMTNSCDYSNIKTWPRRADGSMDYPPPAKASVQFLSASDLAQYSYTTTSNLRLRASADTKASVITTLKLGDHVQVVQKGISATIDGITAPWVQVKTTTGETGWCFGGYLNPKP